MHIKARRLLPILLPAIALLGISCSQAPDNSPVAEPLRPVKTLTVASASQNSWREFPGVIDATRKAELGFSVAGKLEQILVREGEQVNAGQGLAQLEQKEYRLRLSSRQAEFDKADSDLTRARELVKDGHISRSDFDKLKAQAQTASVNLDIARKDLDGTVLKAPFSGRIARKYVDNYEEVSAKQPVFSLHDDSSLTVIINVPESVMLIAREKNQRRLYATFASIADRQFPLTVREVSSQADESTNTFQVTLSMAQSDEYRILPGMSVTVHGERMNPDNNSFALPLHTVLGDEKGNFVYLVDKVDEHTGVIRRQDVNVGEPEGNNITVLSGLTAGDVVVSAGVSKMHPGLKVRIH